MEVRWRVAVIRIGRAAGFRRAPRGSPRRGATATVRRRFAPARALADCSAHHHDGVEELGAGGLSHVHFVMIEKHLHPIGGS